MTIALGFSMTVNVVYGSLGDSGYRPSVLEDRASELFWRPRGLEPHGYPFAAALCLMRHPVRDVPGGWLSGGAVGDACAMTRDAS